MFKRMYASSEEIPEGQKEHYKAGTAGKFYPDVEGVEVEKVPGLVSALQKERASVSKLEGDAKIFEGLDPVKAREAITAVERYGDLTPENLKDKIDTAVETEAGKYKAELEKKDAKIAKTTGQLENVLLSEAAVTAINEAGGDVKVLKVHVLSSSRMVEDSEGNYSTRVVDEKGEGRINGSGSPFTMADLLGELKASDSFAPNFKPTDSSGMGAQQGNGSPGSPGGSNSITVEQMKADPVAAGKAMLDEKGQPREGFKVVETK